MNPIKWLALQFLKVWHMISPAFGPRCRFYPSCSVYAQQAIKKYGLIRGGYKSILRVAKCNPLHPGGYDPLDPSESEK